MILDGKKQQTDWGNPLHCQARGKKRPTGSEILPARFGKRRWVWAQFFDYREVGGWNQEAWQADILDDKARFGLGRIPNLLPYFSLHPNDADCARAHWNPNILGQTWTSNNFNSRFSPRRKVERVTPKLADKSQRATFLGSQIRAAFKISLAWGEIKVHSLGKVRSIKFLVS